MLARPKKDRPLFKLDKGALHRYLGLPEGQEIPVSVLQKLVKKGGHVAKMAQFALNARKFDH